MKNIQSIIFCAATLSVVATQYQTWGINSDRVHCVKEYSELIPKEIKKLPLLLFWYILAMVVVRPYSSLAP
jgi:hypothetical protein